MRAHSEALTNVLKGSFSRRLIVDVFHGSERVMQNLDLLGWSLDGDLGAEVKHSGSGTIVYQSEAGESLVPEGTEGILSPFRARFLLLMEISAGSFSETITLGWFKLTGTPYAVDQFADVNGVRRVVASVVDVEFESQDVTLKRRGFRSEEQPPSLTSCYAELRRITGFPITQTLPDKAIPSAIVYEAAQGGRLKGAQAIAGVLGGRLAPDSAGAMTIISDTPGAVVGSLTIGPEGTVMDVPYSIETDGVYNCVVGNFEDVDRNPIYAVAEVTAGDLATNGLYGEYTRYYASDFVKTQAAADSAVRGVLTQVTGQQQFDVDIQCILNPLHELGDVLKVEGHVRPVEGRLTKYSMSDSELMNVTLRASRKL